jgi:hypothetical protein
LRRKTNTIDLNGKRYDARTGALIGNPIISTPVNKQPLKAAAQSAPATKKTSAMPVKKASVRGSTIAQPVMDISRRQLNNRPSHQLEHAKTLMRTAVSKPQPSFKRQLKSQTPSQDVARRRQTISPKLSSGQIDPQKVAHATQTPKSKLVARFNPAATTASQSTISRTAADISKPVNVQRTVSASQQPSLSIFDKALQTATSHEQKYVKPDSKRLHLSKRLKTLSAVTAAIIVVGGFLIFQNANNINLYFASSKAGFQASIPTYQPVGFDMGKVSATSGAIAANFKSSSDGRSYTLTEKSSQWDDTTLRDSYVTSVAGQNYQTIESAGITIFFYGNHNATWVSGGIWYQLTSKGSLSDQQVIEIATST